MNELIHSLQPSSNQSNLKNKIMKMCTIIRIVNDGEEDYPYISALYQIGDYHAIFNYLKQWDYGDSEEESPPRLALYDRTLHQDNSYILLYNVTIGGTFALYAKPIQGKGSQ